MILSWKLQLRCNAQINNSTTYCTFQANKMNWSQNATTGCRQHSPLAQRTDQRSIAAELLSCLGHHPYFNTRILLWQCKVHAVGSHTTKIFKKMRNADLANCNWLFASKAQAKRLKNSDPQFWSQWRFVNLKTRMWSSETLVPNENKIWNAEELQFISHSFRFFRSHLDLASELALDNTHTHTHTRPAINLFAISVSLTAGKRSSFCRPNRYQTSQQASWAAFEEKLAGTDWRKNTHTFRLTRR